MSRRITVQIGDVYGNLTILDAEMRGKSKVYFWCKCNCGTEKFFRSDELRGREDCGQGCILRSQYLIGQKFGRLEIIAKSPINNFTFVCFCTCGRAKEVPIYNLKNGNTRSCGCLSYESKSNRRTHNMSKTSEYSIWSGMKARCYNPNNAAYYRYGGKKKNPILMCPEWINSFENFYRDMGKRPSKNHSIDRLDNLKGYSKENCAWRTSKEQSNNTRRNTKLTYNGETHSIADWAEITGISLNALRHRHQRGWEIKKMLTTPSRKPEYFYYKGEFKTLSEWCIFLDLNVSTVYNRINQSGWSVERALSEPIKGRKI